MTETLNNDENVIFDSASFDRLDWQIMRHKKKPFPHCITPTHHYKLFEVHSSSNQERRKTC